MSETKPNRLIGRPMLPILAGLAMSLGWGIRGDYGHEAGAMLPGALLALAIVITADRADWQARAGTLAMLGALGWAFGGQMSYGIVIGYTAASTFVDVVYGYSSLFLIGALWGGIGAAILSLGLTWRGERIEQLVTPLLTIYLFWLLLDLTRITARLEARWSFNDTDWVAATSALLVGILFASSRVPRWREPARLIILLAGGWWAGYVLLTAILGLRMTPPRSDNWSGCVGIMVALALWLWREGNRSALLLVLYGLLAGGTGFAVGDFVQMLGRAGWGPIGHYEALQQLDYWKWMERLFGLIMGIGLACGVSRLLQGGLAPVETYSPRRPLRGFALAVLFLIMPWENFITNVRVWMERGQFNEALLGIGPRQWIVIIATLVSVVLTFAIRRHLDGGLPMIPDDHFGRAQLLMLALTWLFLLGDFTRVVSHLNTKGVLSVHVGFWVTALLITLLVVTRRQSAPQAVGYVHVAADRYWLGSQNRRELVVGWLLIPFLILILTKLTLSTHVEPLPGHHQRFSTAVAGQP